MLGVIHLSAAQGWKLRYTVLGPKGSCTWDLHEVGSANLSCQHPLLNRDEFKSFPLMPDEEGAQCLLILARCGRNMQHR